MHLNEKLIVDAYLFAKLIDFKYLVMVLEKNIVFIIQLWGAVPLSVITAQK